LSKEKSREPRSKLRGIIPSALRDCSTYQFRCATLSELEFHNRNTGRVDYVHKKHVAIKIVLRYKAAQQINRQSIKRRKE
jgi:hypothetical protein